MMHCVAQLVASAYHKQLVVECGGGVRVLCEDTGIIYYYTCNCEHDNFVRES